jgi:hypothetical protein
MFWTATGAFGVITVTINNQSATISTYQSNGVPACQTTTDANFTLLEGNYNYTASAPASSAYPSGVSWSGVATVTGNACQLYQLN